MYTYHRKGKQYNGFSDQASYSRGWSDGLKEKRNKQLTDKTDRV